MGPSLHVGNMKDYLAIDLWLPLTDAFSMLMYFSNFFLQILVDGNAAEKAQDLLELGKSSEAGVSPLAMHSGIRKGSGDDKLTPTPAPRMSKLAVDPESLMQSEVYIILTLAIRMLNPEQVTPWPIVHLCIDWSPCDHKTLILERITTPLC